MDLLSDFSVRIVVVVAVFHVFSVDDIRKDDQVIPQRK